MTRRMMWIVGAGAALTIVAKLMRFAWWWVLGLLTVGYAGYSYWKAR